MHKVSKNIRTAASHGGDASYIKLSGVTLRSDLKGTIEIKSVRFVLIGRPKIIFWVQCIYEIPLQGIIANNAETVAEKRNFQQPEGRAFKEHRTLGNRSNNCHGNASSDPKVHKV